MNTLNYKALLIRTGFIVFARALGIYLLLTLPTMGVPMMYMLSAGYALSFGWIAGALFLLMFYTIQKLTTGIITKNVFLYAAVAITVVIAFQMMEVLGAWDHIWSSGGYLIFPGIAIISGWISVAISRHTINILFQPNKTDHYETIINPQPINEKSL